MGRGIYESLYWKINFRCILAISPTYNIVHALFTDLNFDSIGASMFPFILGWGIIVDSLVKIFKLRRKNDEQS